MGKYHRLLAGVVILFLAGCGKSVIPPIGTAQAYFEATVLEVKEHTLLVEPLEGEERESPPTVSVSGRTASARRRLLRRLGSSRRAMSLRSGMTE